jgi:hypothetical protein
MDELPEHARRNRAAWNGQAADYERTGRRLWAQDEPTWGNWDVPEAELRLFPADDAPVRVAR